jgi:hypothetical protein
MTSVIILGWNFMETTDMAVAINASMAFSYLLQTLVDLNVQLERFEKYFLNCRNTNIIFYVFIAAI